MSAINKYGLKRSDLTSQQKRMLRQEAGFGCVVCGNAICEYEHIDPEFADAHKHDVAAMAYLCVRCHGKVTRQQLSKSTILKAKRAPKALEAGFSFEAFDVGDASPRIHFGPMSACNCESIIRINDKPVFWIKEPEESGGPFRLNAEIRKQSGDIIFRISDNEWQVRTKNWDVEVIRNKITVRNGARDIAFVLMTEPPGEIYVDRMDMSVDGFRLYCDGKIFRITKPDGYTVDAQDLQFDRCRSAVEASDEAISFGVGGGSVTFSGMAGVEAKPRRIDAGIRRNAQCPCGSGRRYKQCCGAY